MYGTSSPLLYLASLGFALSGEPTSTRASSTVRGGRGSVPTAARLVKKIRPPSYEKAVRRQGARTAVLPVRHPQGVPDGAHPTVDIDGSGTG